MPLYPLWMHMDLDEVLGIEPPYWGKLISISEDKETVASTCFLSPSFSSVSLLPSLFFCLPLSLSYPLSLYLLHLCFPLFLSSPILYWLSNPFYSFLSTPLSSSPLQPCKDISFVRTKCQPFGSWGRMLTYTWSTSILSLDLPSFGAVRNKCS